MAFETITNPLRGIEARHGTAHYGVFDQGAHVWAYQPEGHAPVVWLGPASDFVEGTPIRGGVPVVFPWFSLGPDGDRTPQHGFARLHTWHLSDTKDTLDRDGRLIVQYRLDDAMTHDEGDAPHDYTAWFTAKFTPDYLGLTLEVRNDGEEPMTFEDALHTYLVVGDVTKVSIEGLDGCSFWDKVARSDATQTGPVTFDGTVDRIYDSKDTVTLVDPVLDRSLVVTKSGSANTVVWNPGAEGAKAAADLADDDWVGMVCVEAGNIGARSITLLPGHTHVLKQRITLA